jgi:hypothetical protein
MKKFCDLLIVALLTIVIAWIGCAVSAPFSIYVSFSSVKDPSLLARLPAAARSSVVVVSLPDAAKITNYGSYSKIDSGQDGALHLYYKTKPMTIARWPNALREQDDRSAVLLASNAHHRQLKCARVCYRWYDHHYQWGVRFSD